MIETEVHQRLRAYLKAQGHTQWPHHLTMARLVARALRVGRSALIQTDSLAAYQGSYRLSYLIPALLWPEPAILALPDHLLETVLQQDIPNLQQNLPVIKPVRAGDRWPQSHQTLGELNPRTKHLERENHENFRGLLVTSAQSWLRDRLLAKSNPHSLPSRFPDNLPTLIDGVGDLESWARAELSSTLSNSDWEALMLAYPSVRDPIRDLRVQITHTIFQHPANPYSCHLIDAPEKELLCDLHTQLTTYGTETQMPPQWQTFWQRFFQNDRLAWSRLDRSLGHLTLCCGPNEIHQTLDSVWNRQPVVLIGAALDPEKKATRYRARLGLGEMTCLQFGPDRHHDQVQLYLPDRLPMPNTSQFKAAVLQEIRTILHTSHEAIASEHHTGPNRKGQQHLRESTAKTDTEADFTTDFEPISPAHRPPLNLQQHNAGPTVIIVGDEPLRTQFASILAAEFGSRVQLESPLQTQGILVTGWNYWQKNQALFGAPALLIITTLPIPSLENPLVASRVALYKKRRQDWFKSYLLPETLSTLQQAIAPVRAYGRNQGDIGIVALLDNRVNHRSYGRAILTSLNPAARSSYLDPTWFQMPQSQPFD